MKNGRFSPTFFTGGPGLHTLGVLLNEDKQVQKKHVQKLLEYYPLCFEQDACYELLYGGAGHLYCLLTVMK